MPKTNMNASSKIIGRQNELDTLSRLFQVTKSGEGGIILIAGEAGMGKTLLAEESLAGSGFNTFVGRANEEITPPYGPITAALRDYARRLGDDKSVNCGPLTLYLGLLLPELGAPPEEPDRDTLVEVIAAALSLMTCEGPAAILLDDLQWADDATLELLPALTERVQVMPLVILGTYRKDEIPRGHRIRWLRNELRRQRKMQEITLMPLDRADAERLIARVLGASPTASLVKTIFQKTQGVPLFVEELTSALVSRNRIRLGDAGIELLPGEDMPIPESVRDAVLLRLDALSEAARNQLEVAAVAGMEFDLHLLTELTGSEDGLDELFDRAFISEIESGRGMFRHALTRDAVRSEIMWSRRRSLNRKIAAYLESCRETPELIAEHWLAANEMEKAREALIESAEKFCHLHAYRDATRASYRALEIWPEGEDENRRLAVLEQLAHCAKISGQLSEAVRALRELLESPAVAADHRRRAEAQRSLATVYGLQGTWEQNIAARKAAAEAFESAGLPGDASIEWLAAASRNTGMYNLKTAIELCDAAAGLAKKAKRWDIQARALALKGNVLSIQGEHQKGIDCVNEGLAIALNHNLHDAAADVYRRLGSTLDYASEYTSSRDAYHTAYNYCQREGQDVQAHLCLGCMSWVLFRVGDWKQCIDTCKEVMGNQEVSEASKMLAIFVLGMIRALRGETRQARKLMKDAMNLARLDEVSAMELVCNWGFAVVDEYDENNSSAEAHYRRMLEIRQEIHDTHDSLAAIGSAVTFFASRKLEKETNMCVNALTEITSATGNTEALGMLAHALGELALLNNSPQDALKQFQQAISHLEKLELPLEKLQAEFRAGIALKQSGDRKSAVTHLMSAYRGARNLGARPLAANIARVLDDMGESAEERRSPEAAERLNRAGLTRRQVEIARLIASGLTNKEIAGKLFLSPRTVEMHVANMLDRLDCRSRSEAVHKAGELGLLD